MSRDKLSFNVPISPNSKPADVEVLPIHEAVWNRRNDPNKVSFFSILNPDSKESDLVFKSGLRFGWYLAHNTDKVWYQGLLTAVKRHQIELEVAKQKTRSGKQNRDTAKEKDGTR